MHDPHDDKRVGHRDGEWKCAEPEPIRGSTDGPIRGVISTLVIYAAIAALFYVGYLIWR